MNSKSKHGGARKGAGRKGEKTKVVRVPIRLLDKFKEFLKTNKI